MDNRKKFIKEQTKKDKARLKGLKQKNKKGQLTEEETLEYISLLNKETKRLNKLTDRNYLIAFIISGINAIILIGWIISIFVR